MTPSAGRRRPVSVAKPDRSVLIRGATLVTMDADHRVGPLDLQIDAGEIAAIGANLPRPKGARIIDARGMAALPGLVQAHVHLCHALGRGGGEGLDLLTWQRERALPLEGALGAEDLRAAARLAMVELLLGGTTTVLDYGTVLHTDVLFEEAAALGLRYTGGKAIMDQGQGYPAALREATAAAIAESVRLCRRWHNSHGGRLRYAFGPRSALMASDAAYRAAVEEARRAGALLHTHAAESAEEVTLTRERVQKSTVDHLRTLGAVGGDVCLAHGNWLTSEERRVVRESGTHVVHCPSAGLRLGSGVARLTELIADGIEPALGTSSAAAVDHHDAFAEMRLCALIHKAKDGAGAVPAEIALRLATRFGASALGLADTGTLEVGKRADVVLLDLRRPHLVPDTGDLEARIVFAARAADVHTVIVDGVVRVDAGTLVGVNLDAVLRNAQAAATRVAARLG
ncbi:MAG: amidohydrolase family protein [Deltaproteobacteria bacterium]|nr:amidohydrolase family protein [Deltaproteobacteria bacterium]